jgi:hypothetical protein
MLTFTLNKCSQEGGKVEKWPRQYPAVFAMIEPTTFLVAVSKTDGFTADTRTRERWPTQPIDNILAMSGDEFVELEDYDYELAKELMDFPLVGVTQ